MISPITMISVVLGTPQESWYSTAAGVVTLLAVVLGSAVLVAFFVHEDDKEGNAIPKIIIILGITTSIMTVLLLPLDVNNRAGGILPMPMIWIVFLTFLAFLAVVALPWAFLWYTADDEAGCCGKCWTVIKWQFWIFLVFAVVLALMFVFLGVAEVPITEHSVGWSDDPTGQFVPSSCSGNGCPVSGDTKIEIQVSFVVYMVGIMAMFGWMFLILFGGVGLVAFPLDLIYAYRNRPVKINLELFAKLRTTCRERAHALLEFGKTFEAEAGGARTQAQRNMFQKFKSATLALEHDWERLKISYKGPFSPLKYYFYLGCGCAGAVVSALWIVHIILFVVIKPPASPFLNIAFVMIEKAFPMVTIFLYCVFAFWFLLSVIAGNIKIGDEWTCFPIYTLVLYKTYLDSFLFNTLLIMSTSIAVISFCATAFRVYARLTAADVIFNVQVRNLKGLNLIWQGFEYALFTLIFLTGLYFVLCKKKRNVQEELENDLTELIQGGGKKRSGGCAIL